MNAKPPLPIDFLLWLDCNVGSWDCGGQQYVVSRRDDGWLWAWSKESDDVSLNWLLQNGKRVAPAESPLGMYPVALSADLMKLWLTPEQCNRLRQAWRVSTGMKIILSSIETAISECDQATRREKCGRMWAAGANEDAPWTEEDDAVYQMLMKQFTDEGG